MRTKQVKKRMPWAQRALFGVVGLTGMKSPDVAYVMLHRPELFGLGGLEDITRIADTLEFEVPTWERSLKDAKHLLKRGYR